MGTAALALGDKSTGKLRRLRAQLRSYPLTPREAHIVLLVIQGYCNKEIAGLCEIGEQTVKDHLRHVYEKTGIHQRTLLVARILGFVAS